MAIVDYLYYRDGSNTGKIALFDSADVLNGNTVPILKNGKTLYACYGEVGDGRASPLNPASRQKITQTPETKQTLLLKALFNRGFFLVPRRVYMI